MSEQQKPPVNDDETTPDEVRGCGLVEAGCRVFGFFVVVFVVA